MPTLNDLVATEADLQRVRAAFLRYLQNENVCALAPKDVPKGKPCHSHKCGCAIEMQNYIDDEN